MPISEPWWAHGVTSCVHDGWSGCISGYDPMLRDVDSCTVQEPVHGEMLILAHFGGSGVLATMHQCVSWPSFCCMWWRLSFGSLGPAACGPSGPNPCSPNSSC